MKNKGVMRFTLCEAEDALTKPFGRSRTSLAREIAARCGWKDQGVVLRTIREFGDVKLYEIEKLHKIYQAMIDIFENRKY